MFDETIRRLERLARGTRIELPVEVDDDGYYDRQCPGSECGLMFKVLLDDWKEKVRQEQVFCPFCREQRGADEWNTEAQAKYMEDYATNHLASQLDGALASDAARFNRRQRTKPRGGMIDISMSMSFRPGSRSVPVPTSAMSCLRQQFTCERCRCGYASLGASFFCPACGHNSAASMFDGTIGTVQALVCNLRETLSPALDPDALEDAVRHVLEDQVVRLVGAYERFADSLFAQLPSEAQYPRRGNHFQRLDDGSNLWREATGSGYDTLLAAAELARLGRYFQQRHVIGHRQGLVDQSYVDRSGDTQYAVGQRLIVRQDDVLELADLLAKLAEGLRKLAPLDA